MAKKNTQNRASKKPLGLLVVLIIVAVAALYIWHSHNKSRVASTTTAAVTGTKSQPVQNHQSQPSTTTGATNAGGAVDQNGKTSGTLPPSSDWVSSTNGDITVQQPSANTTVQSGATLSGLANVSKVSFNLTDNSVGLIAQGTLDVVNGKFSGALQFTPHASSGTLQVYYSNPSTGAEEDIINMDVNFGS
jgi:hypothetical protein